MIITYLDMKTEKTMVTSIFYDATVYLFWVTYMVIESAFEILGVHGLIVVGLIYWAVKHVRRNFSQSDYHVRYREKKLKERYDLLV